MYDSWHSAPIEALASALGKRKNLFMNMIFKSLRQAFESLLSFRMFLLVLLPPIFSILGLMIVFIIFWQSWLLGLSSFLSSLSLFQWLQNMTGFLDFAEWSAVIFLILGFIPMAYLIAVLFTSLFIMPIVLKIVVGKDFKHLEKKRGGSLLGSVWNTVWVTLLFVAVFFVTLPLWLLPGCQILVPLLLTAWLNKKIFLYDVLQDYATAEERGRIEKEESGPLYGLGLILGFCSYVPLVFFAVPVLSALSYTYYGLNALADRRRRDF